MTGIAAVATYVPRWRASSGVARAGADEDALTMAVAAGRAAVVASGLDIVRLALVTRELPLLEGGNAAVLLAGLGLSETTEVVESLGAAPATVDALATGGPGTLVLAADVADRAGAGALVLGPGHDVVLAGRVQRSLPLRLRTFDGDVFEDHDPRLQRERGLNVALERAMLPCKPLAIAGLGRREAAPLCEGDPPELATTGASSPMFAIAALAERGAAGLVAGFEQASLTAVNFGSVGSVTRIAGPGLPVPTVQAAPGPDIKFAFTAYDRAFDAKVRWEAGACPTCGLLAFPPRRRCLGCGHEGEAPLVPLPRTGSVYTTTTIHTAVPGLASPYSLAVVALDGSDVRALVTITDAPAGTVDIGDRGRLVLRRVATRTGVPDYGYAFAPDLEDS